MPTFKHLCAGLCLIGVLALGGCMKTSPFSEIGRTFMLETNRAKYYNVRGYWKSRPSIATTTVKRVAKEDGEVSYGKKASARLDRERVIRR